MQCVGLEYESSRTWEKWNIVVHKYVLTGVWFNEMMNGFVFVFVE